MVFPTPPLPLIAIFIGTCFYHNKAETLGESSQLQPVLLSGNTQGIVYLIVNEKSSNYGCGLLLLGSHHLVDGNVGFFRQKRLNLFV